MLQTAGAGAPGRVDEGEKLPRDARITIRLRAEDQVLLNTRAAARGMPAATYVSVLTRAHLRKLAPLPKEELLALKRSLSELGRIGRLLRVCEGLRDHVKDLLRVNLASWRQGHSDSDDE